MLNISIQLGFSILIARPLMSFLFAMVAALLTTMPTYAHVIPETDLAKSPHWYTQPFDLFFDAKWIAQPNSKAIFNGDDELLVTGEGNFTGRPRHGVRFGLRKPWETFVSGHKIRVTIWTRGSTKEAMPYKVFYSTNEVGSSPVYTAIANPNSSQFSFEYKVPQLVEGKNDLLYIIPTPGSDPLIIENAQIELITDD